MTVAVILQQKGSAVITTGPGTILSAVAELLATHRIGAVLVVGQNGRLEGIISERDIVRAIGQQGAEALKRPVADFMTAQVVTCGRDDSIAYLMQKMTQGKFRHVPVLEDGKVVGIVSIGDVVKERIAAAEAETEAMRTYITTA
ncbi:CBS domain-containing protein [Lutibaculum baratangense]|uniref:CBS domain protein n=1 Tax=Lutibaculum baratangense AMV1 TaxID=631454 RepID=V4QZH0_9HYPH|nr:CBS domain-containing protein [Lutibaculum baratangense]ESR25157.1 CBS domain protein [Lutibaculum baratangense AMV1]